MAGSAPPPLRLRARAFAAMSVVLVGTVAGPRIAGDDAPALRLEAVLVKPAVARADTLCHLEARIANGGARTASAFAFRLALDGHDIGAYRDHLFMDPIAPGETRTLTLWSFWTNETSRPLPASGTLAVELTLESARWMKVEKDADGVSVWSDLGAVEGLPQTARADVKIDAKK
jgi:hypothetical protein